MSEGFFSKSAKKLADAHGIKLDDIYTHRGDGLATVDNVRCHLLKRHTEGLLVQMQLKIAGIKPTQTNMVLLKRWYSKYTESLKHVFNVSDIKLFVVPAQIPDPQKPPRHPPVTIQIDYRLHVPDTRLNEAEIVNKYIVSRDRVRNAPIYVNKEGKITSIDVGKPNGGEPMIVSAKVINSRVVSLIYVNNFGTNYGLGMTANPTPYKIR